MAGHQKERAEFVPPPATKEEREKLDTTIISPTVSEMISMASYLVYAQEFQMAEGGVRRRIVVDGSNFLFEGGKKAHCTQEIIE